MLPKAFFQPMVDFKGVGGDSSVPGDDGERNLTQDLLKGNHAQVEAATKDVARAQRVEDALEGAEPPRHRPGNLRPLA